MSPFPSATSRRVFRPLFSRRGTTVAACLFIAAVAARGVAAADVDDAMDAFVKRKQIAGAVTLVIQRSKIVHLQAHGVADVAQQRRMRTDSLFQIASMTKPITATAMMMLVEEGKLELDVPVSKYIPAFARSRDESGKPVTHITLRHLITHTAGIGRPPNDEHRYYRSPREVAEFVAGMPIRFAPGSKWQYGVGPTVVGHAIERVTGQSIGQFLRDRLFDPLDMVDTTFHPSRQQQERVATIYQPAEDSAAALAPFANPYLRADPTRRVAPNPSGGLFSTAADLSRFYRMILAGGKLDGHRYLSEDSVRRMTTLQTDDLKTGFTPGNGWGLGWCVVREPQGVSAPLSPGSFGHGGAYGTQAWLDPQKGAAFVLLIQRTKFGNSDASDVRDAFQRAAQSLVE